VAPALHSLIIREREDVVRIVKTLSDSHVDIRKLILKRCQFGKDGPGMLKKILALFPDLEVLSLEALSLECGYQLTSADYSVISHLKKLSELNISHSRVNYMHVKLLQIHVCIRKYM
jgi:hypothetical protein